MLVLSRCLGEKLIFIDPLRPGQPFELQLVDLRGDKARIGLTLPPDIRVWREELLPISDCRLPIADCAGANPSAADAPSGHKSQIENQESQIGSEGCA